MTDLVYRPWVPREGMRGWFAHLSKAYGDPNKGHGMDGWPRAVLERVCERGAPIPLVCDQDFRDHVVMFTHQGIFVDGELMH